MLPCEILFQLTLVARFLIFEVNLVNITTFFLSNVG